MRLVQLSRYYALESYKTQWISDSTLNLQPTEEELKDGDPTERAGLYEGDIDMAYHEVCQEIPIKDSNPG